MKKTLLLVLALLLSGWASAQVLADKNIVNGVNYAKPLEEHVLEHFGEQVSESHSFYTYDGDSLSRVVYYEKDSLEKTIYEFEWQNNTKSIFITIGGERSKVLEAVYDDKLNLLKREVFYSFSFDFGHYALSQSQMLWSFMPKSKLERKYNERGLIVEEVNEYMPGWINVKKYEYDGLTRYMYFEKYTDGVRTDASDFYLKGEKVVFKDDKFDKQVYWGEIRHNGEISHYEKYEYDSNDSLVSTEIYYDGRNTNTIYRKYDSKGRVLENEDGLFDYETFTKIAPFGIRIKYLDENFDKIVSYNIMGMSVENSYDKYKRVVSEKRENGPTSNPDFDAKYEYDGNVMTCIRHERGFLDKKGEKSITKNIKVVYEKVK